MVILEIQDCTIPKSINIICCINRLKEKKKTYDHFSWSRKIVKNSISIHDYKKKKNLSKLWIRGNFLNLINGVYKKNLQQTPYIIRLSPFPLLFGIRGECLLLPLLFNISLKVLACAVRHLKLCRCRMPIFLNKWA